MLAIGNYAGFIRGRIVAFYRTIREQWLRVTTTIIFICLPVYAIVWLYDDLDNLGSNIGIIFTITLWPFLRLMAPREPVTVASYEVWFAVFVWLSVILVIGDRFDSQLVMFSATLVFLALPGIVVVTIAVSREVVLLAGFAPAFVATMVYWFAGLAENDQSFDLALFPLPTVFIVGAIWSLMAIGILRIARRYKHSRIWGPGMQVLAMTLLFFPTALVAVTVPPDLGLSSSWTNVSLALIGLSLSATISEPLRRLLIEMGNLAPDDE